MQRYLFDHLLVVVLVVVMPLWGVRDHRRLEAAVRAGVPDARIRAYQRGMVQEWGLTIILFVLWGLAGRSLVELGLVSRAGQSLWLIAGVTVVACSLPILQTWQVARSEKALASVRAQFEALRSLLPHDDRESAWFRALSVTAGICEEVLYRGYLIWYATAYVGLWPAAALSAVVFGVGHAYQGAAGVVKTGVLGAIFALIYLWTGSLWPSILAHATIDLTTGIVARKVVDSEPLIAEPASS